MIPTLAILFALSHPCHDCPPPPPPPPIVSCFEEADQDKAKLRECKERWIAVAERTNWRGIARFWTWVKLLASAKP